MAGKTFETKSLKTTPWKNGGGITREIATSEEGSPFWRISIANVDQDGPFSLFPGLKRILTVIHGNGMRLVSPNQILEANLNCPVHFSGEDNIYGYLSGGPIQDFNLIYDAQVLSAQVLVGSIEILKSATTTNFDHALIYCLAGSIPIQDSGILKAHMGAFVENSNDLLSSDETAIGLWISIQNKSE